MKSKDVNTLRQEFIGKKVEVPEKDIKGTIIDETKNSFVIQIKNDTKKDKKRVLKTSAVFHININNEFVAIDGKAIAVRSEDRIKLKKWK